MMIYVLTYIVSFEYIECTTMLKISLALRLEGRRLCYRRWTRLGLGGLWQPLSSTSLDEAGLGVATSVIMGLLSSSKVEVVVRRCWG